MKWVLVTGASRGLGLAITRQLLEQGDGVIALSRHASVELQSLEGTYPASLRWHELDLATATDLHDNRLREWMEEVSPLTGLVNNAAIAYDDLVSNLQPEPLATMFQVNVFAPMMLTRGMIRHCLLHNLPGSIVHVSSVCVHTGYKGLAMYGATKGAMEAFSKNTAREWGSRGIRSNCVVPGFMETDMTAGMDDDTKHRVFRRTALQRPTDPESVASTVAFLLSDRSNSITGQNVFVDSGTI